MLIYHNDWHYVDLVLELKLPLLIHKRTVGNVVETLDYLPGTHLLPILSKELRQSNPNIGEAISQGNLLVTHAFLEVGEVRGRPVPLGLFSEKLDKDKFYNLLQISSSEIKPQIKGSRSGYVGKSDDFVKLGIKTVNKEVATHNTVDDQVQRPTERVGGVYSYEALSPGTKLRAQLRVRGKLATNLDWLQSLNRTYRIGRANKDDYGLVKLTVDGELKSCSQEKNKEKNVEETQTLIVWLLSDVLLRDKRLRPSASLTDFRELLEKELKELNVKLKERGTRDTDDKLSVIARQSRTESWHNKWALPRPSLVGLAAGTCIVYEVSGGKLDPQILGNLEASGIGERRAEGYGQLCFNDSLLMQNKFTIASEKLSDKPDLKGEKISDQDVAFNYAQLIEEQAWRKAIENKALELAAKKETAKKEMREEIIGLRIEEKNGQKKSKPSLSQLGALRSVLAKLQKPNDRGVIKWIEAVEKEKVENRKAKWGDSIELIKDLVTNSSKVWEHFNLTSSDLMITQSGDEIIKSQLWVYAVQVLVDALRGAGVSRCLHSRSQTGGGKLKLGSPYLV